MRVGVVGAGFTGLSAAYALCKEGAEVKVFEARDCAGGLAAGVRECVDDYPADWDWDLEQFYHHSFVNDREFLSLIGDLGAKDSVLVKRPLTASWVQGKAWPLDSAFSLLQFSPLSFVSRVRMGLVLAYLKWGVNAQRSRILEKVSASGWLSRTMGEEAYRLVWEPLLRGKFGSFADQVSAAWFWARVFKRTARLVYFSGGYSSLIGLLMRTIEEKGGEIKLGKVVEEIVSRDEGVVVDGEKFDQVLVTVSPQEFVRLVPSLSINYRQELSSLESLGAYCLILVLDKPLLEEVYWLNINEEWPFLAVVEHTNFVSPRHYGNKHIVYVGGYLPKNHSHMKKEAGELLELFRPYLSQLNPKFNQVKVDRVWLFKENYAQPLMGVNYSKLIPSIDTPVKGLYYASMNQVYPWDRGTNYAVKMGGEVAESIMSG